MENLRDQVEQIARRSEVRAVAQAMREGCAPRVGDVLDYTIDLPGAARRANGRLSTYRFAVEPWHLAAAVAMIGLGPRTAPVR